MLLADIWTILFHIWLVFKILGIVAVCFIGLLWIVLVLAVKFFPPQEDK